MRPSGMNQFFYIECIKHNKNVGQIGHCAVFNLNFLLILSVVFFTQCALVKGVSVLRDTEFNGDYDRTGDLVTRTGIVDGQRITETIIHLPKNVLATPYSAIPKVDLDFEDYKADKSDEVEVRSGVYRGVVEGEDEERVYCSGYDSRCQCSDQGTQLACRNAGFREIPNDLPGTLLKLDLRGNNITLVRRTAFLNSPHLDELVLSENALLAVSAAAFSRVSSLRRLSMQRCSLHRVPAQALRPLTKLNYLQLDKNELVDLDADSFAGLRSLQTLRLEGNKLRQIPTHALRPLVELEALNIGNNLITELPIDSFPTLQKLVILLLRRNHISIIDDSAFVNLTSLRVLELDDNVLTDIPLAIHKLPSLQELSVSGNRISYIGGGALQASRALALLELRGNPLMAVDPMAFTHLPKLRKLTLSDARALREFPSLNGTGALETLRLDRAAIHTVPAALCRTCPKLKTLDVKSNRLTELPDLNGCKDLRVLDLASNQISSLGSRRLSGLPRLHDLILAHNSVTKLTRDVFHGLDSLQLLDLEDNEIGYIHPDAFLPISNIEDLNLANNIFPTLPPSGLQKLLHLKTFNNPNLKTFHQPEVFPRIQTLVLSYAYHCCAFIPAMAAAADALATAALDAADSDGGGGGVALTETILFPKDNEFDMSLWTSNQTDIWPQYGTDNISKKFGTKMKELWESFGSDFSYPGNLPSYADEYFEDYTGKVTTSDWPPRKIHCLPLPGPFLPCEDLFDWWTLRCGVWVVFLLAMLGNGTVVFVLVFSRSKMDVPRFLVCNLAAADFFMGIYLGFLAVVDASTLGEFRRYAIRWQMSAACRLAGFLGVLSSELGVYTLAVITLERNYAITHAMHLNKRLSLRHAAYVMAAGWTFAIIAATLPLFGISDYRKFAVCLPFETEGTGSLSYVVFLMFINGLAFLVLMGCYLKMYCAIRGSQAWNSNDSRIAKRMALLVFTDFLCWSPIAFFSLTAAFGLQLVSLEQAKVFTVFVLPLNSCCNPFLYAILTKQFKKDCVLICKAIEESRVTRGIGRCRHSSNFSNRQTPANTNSLAERSSRGHVPACACRAKLLGESAVGTGHANNTEAAPSGGGGRVARWLASCARRDAPPAERYAYRAAAGGGKKRRGSASSSDNFSSSRSDSWRAASALRCGAPLRLLAPARRASSWLAARKTSQDSNLSSSRNDSSGSATTASTSTWRASRSSGGRPRLTRQLAVLSDEPPLSVAPCSPIPGRLAVRFLTTIPSAAETSLQLDDDDAPRCVLHAPPHESQSSHPSHSTHTSPHAPRELPSRSLERPQPHSD